MGIEVRTNEIKSHPFHFEVGANITMPSGDILIYVCLYKIFDLFSHAFSKYTLTSYQ